MMSNFAERFLPEVDPASLVRQERAVKPFDRLLLKGYGRLEIVLGQAPGVTIVSHENLVDRLGSRVVDGRLILGFESWWDKVRHSLSTSLDRQPILYRVNAELLRAVEIQGLAQVRGRGIAGESFALAVRGIADIRLQELQAGTLAVHMATGGRIALDGQVEAQRVTIRGPGAYLAAHLVSQQARINIQGPGQAAVNVQEKLQVRIAGPGRVMYRGRPVVEKRLLGPAVVRPVADGAW